MTMFVAYLKLLLSTSVRLAGLGPDSISGAPEYKAGGLSPQPWPTVSFVLPGISCIYLDWSCNEDNFVGFLQFYCTY
jgi:hypothetical protein